jgi:hypothetical protein
MNTVIQDSLKNAFSYEEYRLFVTKLFENGKTTGHTQTQDLVHYTELNQARMHRLDKTIKVVPEVNDFLQALTKQYIWLVISESWCGDAAQTLPVINKMAMVTDKIEYKIVLRDDNDELMQLFLTNGTKSIPVLIIIDKETGKVINHYGPRPIGAKQLILDYKEQHGVVDEIAKTELQKWYLQDKGESIQKEIIALM